MEILWWLAPPAAATVLAMLWVSWLGRSGRGQVDREVAVRRLGEAMARPSRVPARDRGAAVRRTAERSTGVAVRRTPGRPGAPADITGDVTEDGTHDGTADGVADGVTGVRSTRRAS